MRKMTRRRVATAILLSALGAASGAVGQDLAGSQWQPTDIGGLAIPDKAGLFVRFEAQGKLAGYGGCNHFFGGYQTHGERIKIGAMGMSLMACAPAIAKREARFVKALEGARFFRRDRIRLALYEGTHKTRLIKLVQTDAD
jgi:heat shock protein HslJ